MGLFKSLFKREAAAKEAYLNRLEDLKDDIRNRNDQFGRGPIDHLNGQKDLAPEEWLAIARDIEPEAELEELAPEPVDAAIALPAELEAVDEIEEDDDGPSLTQRAAADEHLKAVLAGLEARPQKRAA